MSYLASIKSVLRITLLAPCSVAAGYVSWSAIDVLMSRPGKPFTPDLLAATERVCSLSAACVKVGPIRFPEPGRVQSPDVGFVAIVRGKAADRAKLAVALKEAVASSPHPMTIRLVDESTQARK